MLTGTHDITKFGRERQDDLPRSGRDIVIEEQEAGGSWYGGGGMAIRCSARCGSGSGSGS